MKLGTLGAVAFDASNLSFNSGGQRNMSWGAWLASMLSVAADVPPANSSYAQLVGDPVSATWQSVNYLNNANGQITQSSGPVTPLQNYDGGVTYGWNGNAYIIPDCESDPSNCSKGKGGWQFLQALQSGLGYTSYPASALTSVNAFEAWIASDPKLESWAEGAYIWTNNQPLDSGTDWGGLLVMGAVAAFAALAIYTAAAAQAAQAAAQVTQAAPVSTAVSPSSAITSVPSTGEASATSTATSSVTAAPASVSTAAPVETATVTPVTSADVSTLTAEGFPTSAIASPLTSTGTASAVSTAAEAATSSPTSLLTSGAGLLQQAAPAIAAGTALVKKIFGAQTAPVTTGAYVPVQRRINPLFIGAGILLLAVVVKKGGGKKGKHHEPRTDFVR